jgi:hypothetical protein
MRSNSGGAFKGSFEGVKVRIALPSSGEVPTDLLSYFGSRNERSMRVRRFTRSLKKIADRFGAKIPKAPSGTAAEDLFGRPRHTLFDVCEIEARAEVSFKTRPVTHVT